MPPAAVFRSRRAAQYIIPDCRARMFQFAFERALLPFKQDKPLLPTPLFRLPKASPNRPNTHAQAPHDPNKRGAAPLGGLRRPFTPISVWRKPGEDEPVRVRKGADARQTRQATEANAGAQGAKGQPFAHSNRTGIFVNRIPRVCRRRSADTHKKRNAIAKSNAYTVLPACRRRLGASDTRRNVVSCNAG